MTHKIGITALAAVAMGIFIGLATTAQSGGQAGALVRLQPTSPGLTQVGNAHVSGALIAEGNTPDGNAIFGSSTDTAAFAIVGAHTNPSGTLRSGGVQASSAAANGFGLETSGAGTGFGTALLAKSSGSVVSIISSNRTAGTGIGLQVDLASPLSAGISIEKTNGELTEVASANGGLFTEGIVYKRYEPNGPRVAAIPIAYGTINASSTVASGSGNFGDLLISNVYNIVVDNETLTAANATAIITPNATSVPRIATYNFSGGNLQVRIFDTAGNLTQTNFSFVIYSASPASDDGPTGDSPEDRRFGKPVEKYERRKLTENGKP